MVQFCCNLLMATLQCVTFGLFLGIYSNLSPNWAETIVVLVVAFAVSTLGQHHIQELVFKTCPIESYHLPLWSRLVAHPSTVFTRRGREQLRKRAKEKAEEVKRRAYREREMLDPTLGEEEAHGHTSIGVLLRRAAVGLGRAGYDVSIYEARLEQDWYNDVSQLRGVDVDILSRYMPRLLAQRVHEMIESGEVGFEPHGDTPNERTR